MKKRICALGYNRFGVIAVVCILVGGIFSSAAAFEIPTGNEDVKVRWDNSFRYNYGTRVADQEDPILNNPNYDDGDRNFSKGTVTNRLDLMSEFDLYFKESVGFRVSGAAWYDQRYHDPMDNDSVATSNHLVNGNQSLGLAEQTKKYHGGPDVELLDAFMFGKMDLGPVPLSVKVGRHTIYWGESLLAGGAVNGISYGQTPLDLAKAFAVPGSEAKELFRPLFNISAQMQLPGQLAIFGQYFLQWESYRFPEAGSYLNNADFLMKSAESLLLYGSPMYHGNDSEPDGKKNWGVGMTWSPDFMDGGRLGLYYRRTADMMPQVHLQITSLIPFAGNYNFAFADGIDIYGLSFSKEIGGISVGAEYSLRRNMTLNSGVVAAATLPSDGNTYGARGNTQHANLNFMGLLSKSLFYQSAAWNAELSWSHWDKVTQDDYNVFLGREGYRSIDRVTRNALGLAVNFTPTWYQVFPGMDLSMPINYSRGLWGVSPLFFGDAQNSGNAGIGLSLEVYTKYTFAVTYINYFGNYDATAGAVSSSRGAASTISDRDWISFMFKFAL